MNTAIVSPRTSTLQPEEQAQSVVVHTPPEVIAYNNGEHITAGDMVTVRKWYRSQGLSVPVLKQPEEPVFTPAPMPKRITKVKPAAGSGTPKSDTTALSIIADMALQRLDDVSLYLAIEPQLKRLSNGRKEECLQKLAELLGYEVA